MLNLIPAATFTGSPVCREFYSYMIFYHGPVFAMSQFVFICFFFQISLEPFQVLA